MFRPVNNQTTSLNQTNGLPPKQEATGSHPPSNLTLGSYQGREVRIRYLNSAEKKVYKAQQHQLKVSKILRQQARQTAENATSTRGASSRSSQPPTNSVGNSSTTPKANEQADIKINAEESGWKNTTTKFVAALQTVQTASATGQAAVSRPSWLAIGLSTIGNLFDAASGGVVKSGSKPAPRHENKLSSTGVREIEKMGQGANAKFDISRSPLLRKGEVPQLIVIGDTHDNLQLQQSFKEIVRNLDQNNPDFKKLLVEDSDDPSDMPLCTQMRSDPSLKKQCIGVDPPNAEKVMKAKVKEVQDAFDSMSSAIYDFSNKRGIKGSADLDPKKHKDKPVGQLMSVATVTYFKQIEKLMKKVDQSSWSEFMDPFISFNTVWNQLVGLTTDPARNEHMLKKTKEEVGPGHITMLVVGNAHVKAIKNDLLANVKCVVLTSKESGQNKHEEHDL